MVMCCTTAKCILYHGIIGCYAMVTVACPTVSNYAINNSLCTTVCSPLAKHCISLMQAGLVLCQGYIPEKCQTNQNCANQTQNSHRKQCIYCGVRGLTTPSIYCMTTPLLDIRTCRVYTVHIYFYTIYLFI
jgi:hypothetical protein